MLFESREFGFPFEMFDEQGESAIDQLAVADAEKCPPHLEALSINGRGDAGTCHAMKSSTVDRRAMPCADWLGEK